MHFSPQTHSFSFASIRYRCNRQKLESFFKTKLSNIDVYKPHKQVLGAHANIYSANFAKVLYNYKLINFNCQVFLNIF